MKSKRIKEEIMQMVLSTFRYSISPQTCILLQSAKASLLGNRLPCDNCNHKIGSLCRHEETEGFMMISIATHMLNLDIQSANEYGFPKGYVVLCLNPQK